MIRHILVPTDFSDTASAALVYAVELCRTLKGKITLLHVVNAQRLENELMGLNAIGYLSAANERVEEMLPAEDFVHRWKQMALDRLQSDAEGTSVDDVPIEAACTTGRPSQKIVEYARAHDVDLIVMGTHGRGPVAHFFLGSVTENVLRSASCPVLTVRSA